MLQADGGTRTAAVTGGYVALADAVECLARQGRWPASRPTRCSARCPRSASASSAVNRRLDLCYEEDVAAHTDMNVVCTASGDFVEIQGTTERVTQPRPAWPAVRPRRRGLRAGLTQLQDAALALSPGLEWPPPSRMCNRHGR